MDYYINGRPHTHEIALDIDIFTDKVTGEVTTYQYTQEEEVYLINDQVYDLILWDEDDAPEGRILETHKYKNRKTREYITLEIIF